MFFKSRAKKPRVTRRKRPSRRVKAAVRHRRIPRNPVTKIVDYFLDTTELYGYGTNSTSRILLSSVTQAATQVVVAFTFRVGDFLPNSISGIFEQYKLTHVDVTLTPLVTQTIDTGLLTAAPTQYQPVYSLLDYDPYTISNVNTGTTLITNYDKTKQHDARRKIKIRVTPRPPSVFGSLPNLGGTLTPVVTAGTKQYYCIGTTLGINDPEQYGLLFVIEGTTPVSGTAFQAFDIQARHHYKLKNMF